MRSSGGQIRCAYVETQLLWNMLELSYQAMGACHHSCQRYVSLNHNETLELNNKRLQHPFQGAKAKLGFQFLEVMQEAHLVLRLPPNWEERRTKGAWTLLVGTLRAGRGGAAPMRPTVKLQISH